MRTHDVQEASGLPSRAAQGASGEALDLEALEVGPERRVSFECAVVRGTSPLTVELAGGLCAARRAKSCLVTPDAGDRVLCARAGEQTFVLAVLEGEAHATTRIAAEGDLELHATGRLELAADDHVQVSAGSTLELLTGKLTLRAKSALAAIEGLVFAGRSVEAHVARAVLVAERLEARADRYVQRAKQVFRFVERLDQLRAGVIDARAESLAALRGENTIVAARVLVKLDGEQVKIG